MRSEKWDVRGEWLELLLKMFREIVGDMDMHTNIYVVADEKTKEGIVIDPGGAIDKIYNYIENMHIIVKYIILTHCHADHIAGLKALHNYYPNSKVMIHEKDRKGLTDYSISMCGSVGIPVNTVDADITLKDGDIVKFGDMKEKIIHTPGHTEGSISILINDALFTGDTLFKRMYGRTDLPSGSDSDIQFSIRNLLSYPDNTIVYPGHGAISIIREEREHYEFMENGMYFV